MIVWMKSSRDQDYGINNIKKYYRDQDYGINNIKKYCSLDKYSILLLMILQLKGKWPSQCGIRAALLTTTTTTAKKVPAYAGCGEIPMDTILPLRVQDT